MFPFPPMNDFNPNNFSEFISFVYNPLNVLSHKIIKKVFQFLTLKQIWRVKNSNTFELAT